MERPKENRTQASESGTQQGHHLQGKPHVFILRLYFNFKGVHKHANVTTQANSATWKLQCRMEGVGMVLQSYWPSVKLIWSQSASTGSWPNYFDGKQEHLYLEPFRNDSYGEQVVFDTLSKILKGTMDIPRKQCYHGQSGMLGYSLVKGRTASFKQQHLQRYHFTKQSHTHRRQFDIPGTTTSN